MSRVVLLKVLVLTAVVVAGAGCGSTSFVSRGYENFTAYYNKFYNAQRSFDAADERMSAPRPIDRQLLLTVFPIADRAGTSNEYEDTIRKSADVLRGHENSKWVDDALMLIGRAYFNQNNFVSAEQKFREVMALDTKLHDEALYWLTRSRIAGNEHDAALSELQLAVEDEEISRKWRPFLYLALGDVNARLGNYEEAAQALTEGLDARDRVLTGRARFLLGQVHERLGDFETAVEMYHLVERHKPPYELLFAAKARAIEVGAAHGDFETADRALRRMERDDKNFEYRNDLALVRARIQTANGEHAAAVATLATMLRGTTPPSPQIRGGAHYTLAVIYRDVYVDYDRAAAHFDTAATALRGEIQRRLTFGVQHSIDDPFAPGAIVDVLEQRDIFAAFARVSERLARMDSLLTLGLMEDDEFRQRIEEIRQLRIAELKEQDRLREKLDIQGQFSDAAATEFRGGLPPGKIIDNDPSAMAAGFLFHREPVRVQQAFEHFRERWGERPLVPGWRVSSNISGSSRERGVSLDSALVTDAAVGSDDRYANVTVDLSDVPRSRAARERMLADRALARYEMGNVLFLSMNMPDSASAWYRLVIDEDGDEPVAARAHYALAESYRAVGKDDLARSVDADFHRKFPGIDPTLLAAPPNESTPDRALLVDDPDADAAYQRAFDSWQQQEYAAAIRTMLITASVYPEATAAPRSLLAVGVVGGDWARRDSLDLLEPLPTTVPDSVAASFGWSIADSAVTSMDSTLAPVDTGLVQLDTSLTPVDSLLVQVDSSLVAVDSSITRVQPVDSSLTRVQPVDSSLTRVQPVDSTLAQERAYKRVSVVEVYEYLIGAYPREPEAAQAGAALQELHALASARQAVRDSLAALTTTASDRSLAQAGEATDGDTTRTAIDVAAIDVATVDTAAIDTAATIDVAAGDNMELPVEDPAVASADTTAESIRADAVFDSAVPDKRAASAASVEFLARMKASADSAAALHTPSRIYDVSAVNIAPRPVGGEEALLRAISLDLLEPDLSGTIELTFIVSAEGRVTQVTIDEGLSEAADREVLRVMYQSRYSPGIKDDLPVAVRMKRSVVLTVD
jgi:tetratricopeptide (TPR) repeat protein